MAKYVIEDTTLTNIADSIRSKTGKSDMLLPSQMPTEIQNISGGGGSDTGYEPNADMKWAKQVCIDDVQEGFTYKVLEMISDEYVYHDIVVPSGGAVKTSDGAYYTANTKHTWSGENDREPEYYQNIKLRWIITYYSSQTTSTLNLYDDVIYAVIDGLNHSNIPFGEHYSLEYFEYINNGRYTGTKFSSMFGKCYNLQSIPELDTSNSRDLGGMFNYCYSLKTIPKLNTSNGTSFTNMFNYCISLESIPELDTSKGTLFSGMFNYCYTLESIPELDTSNGTTFANMFNYCYSLKTIPKLNTSKGTSFSSMFRNCYTLETIPELDTSNSNNFGNMFNNCYSLKTIPKLDTSNGITFSNMFNYCRSLERIPNLDVSKGTGFIYMFFYCESLKTIPRLNTSKGTSFAAMFDYCDSLQTITELDFSSASSIGTFTNSDSKLEFIKFLNIKKSMNLSSSTKFSRETLVNNVLNNLVDLTGQTAQTLTLGSTNLSKLTDEDKLIATSKNWVIA